MNVQNNQTNKLESSITHLFIAAAMTLSLPTTTVQGSDADISAGLSSDRTELLARLSNGGGSPVVQTVHHQCYKIRCDVVSQK